MGLVKVIKSDDGKPYISLEDLIKELEEVRLSLSVDEDSPPEFLNTIIHTLNAMEQEYYTKTLTHEGSINLQENGMAEPVPEEQIQTIDDAEGDLVEELLRKLKFSTRKLNEEKSKIADEIDIILMKNLIIREWVSQKEMENFNRKMIGIRTICAHSNLKYEYWTMLVDAFQSNSMTIDEVVEMIQQRMQNGTCKKYK